jgi:hypothetical protein
VQGSAFTFLLYFRLLHHPIRSLYSDSDCKLASSVLSCVVAFGILTSWQPISAAGKKVVVMSTTNLCSPHYAGCEENTFTNTNVPFIATARATPGT